MRSASFVEIHVTVSCIKTLGVVQQFEKNEMSGACGAYGGGERCAQGSGGET